MTHFAFHSAAIQTRRTALVIALAALGLAATACDKKKAGDEAAKPGGTIKLGLIASFSGPFADVGKQIENGMKTWMKEHGDTVAGKKIEILRRDTTGPVPDVAKRLAQELVTRDKVDFLVGFGFTPEALAVAAVATEGKTPMIIMNAATSVITTKSPYIVRISLTLPQVAAPMGDWALKNGIKKVSTIVSDFGPGIDAETFFKKTFTAGGGTVLDSVRVPLNNPDYSAFMQRVKDTQPEAVFVFVPATEQCVAFMKAFKERGLADAGIKIIATGDLVDDHQLPTIGEAALGVVSTHHYSIAHDSPENKAFLKAYLETNGPEAGAPNFMSVAAYDGMAAIYHVIEKLGGTMDADKALAILKGYSRVSPRGPITIDPETRDIVQTIYVRRTEKVDGQYRNVEIEQVGVLKDPGK